ncbi:MAG: hypothetical protein QXM43_08425 [Desulfurococcaceae archaeon]
MKPQVAREEVFKEVIKKSMGLIRASPVTSEGLPKYGTAVLSL